MAGVPIVESCSATANIVMNVSARPLCFEKVVTIVVKCWIYCIANIFSVHHEVANAQRKGALINERMLSEYRAFKLTPEELYDFFENVRNVASSAVNDVGVPSAEVSAQLATLALQVRVETTGCCLITGNERRRGLNFFCRLLRH